MRKFNQNYRTNYNFKQNDYMKHDSILVNNPDYSFEDFKNKANRSELYSLYRRHLGPRPLIARYLGCSEQTIQRREDGTLNVRKEHLLALLALRYCEAIPNCQYPLPNKDQFLI